MNKMIISALLIIGLVGMIGTAAALTAVGGTVVDVSSNPVLGATVKAYSDAECQTPLGTNSGVTDGEGNYLFTIPDLDDGTPVWVKAEEGNREGTTESIVEGTELAMLDIVVADITMDIPEFPTIALPVAAILGLMFIISSRKKEE